jgi:hypothetical protein
MLTAIAVVLFLIGLFNLFLKDLIWQFTSAGGPLEGLPAERTPAWDWWMNLSGAVALGLGLYFWFYLA